ncbi:MAG: glycosyltransferase family 4 protein [Methanosarcinales archaeon]|nr:glycosyltransferase family 4 protein [Methanosarcinales archaeon]
MKIAYLSTEFPPQVYGGLGVYVDSISRELAAMDNKVSVFTLGDGDLKRRQTSRGITAFRENPVSMRDALEVFFSPETLSWGEGLDLLTDLLSYNQLAASRILENGPYDVCVAHDWLGLPAGLAVKRKGLPLIFHVHSLEAGRSDHPNPQLVNLELRGARLADAVITVSQAMKEELADLGVDEDKIRVCYHGVDYRALNPASIKQERLDELRSRYGISPEDRVVLFLGRLEPVKGVSQLLEALPLIRERHPRARLLIVGRGTLESRVREALERLGGVTLVTDFLDREAKMYHYALADLCVFPSLYEPFGIVALEAAAMEKPAVIGASGISGLREIVENPGKERPTGVHVNPRDPADIAWGIDLALQDMDRLKEWGRNARARGLEMFTWRRAAEETLEIYREVAGFQS